MTAERPNPSTRAFRAPVSRLWGTHDPSPGLHIVGTPIGNLDDITLRALQTLREASLVLAEDTRHTSILFARHGIHRPLASCHKFNEASRMDEVAARIHAGGIVALVSDSGMPGISDPGSRIVRGCRERGLPVWVVPGPSAVVSAVSLSGWGDDGFTFAGFLPPSPARAGTPCAPSPPNGAPSWCTNRPTASPACWRTSRTSWATAP
ncbi:MAG: ribosomal RNA small subunit methyltransferase I [Kiritimatiellia bacterium]